MFESSLAQCLTLKGNFDNSKKLGLDKMELEPIDFFPGYEVYNYRARRRSRNFNTFISSVLTHLLAMVIAVGICAGAFYYYDHYMKTGLDSIFNQNRSDLIQNRMENGHKKIEDIIRDMVKIKGKMEETTVWRKHLDDLFSKIYLDQESIVDGKIQTAIDLYDADKVGLFDYASAYAYGSIISTPETAAYPANKSISFFNLVNVNILSDPELMLQPNNLPGNCFAFHGSKGKVRIKLGSPIMIRSVTIDHIKLLEDATSAPREFEVYGLHEALDINGVFLGRFVYDLKGRPYQSFRIEEKYMRYPFEYVELSILSNYGKKEFTCVYRFRVHKLYRGP